MHNYQKVYTDDVGGFIIQQLRDDGTMRTVSPFHQGFGDWLKFNLLPEVAYVKPEPVTPSEPVESEIEKLTKRIEALETKMPTVEAAISTLTETVEAKV